MDINKPKVFYSSCGLIAALVFLALIGDLGIANLASWSFPLFIRVGGICFGVSLITLAAEFFLYFMLGVLYCFSERREKVKAISVIVLIVILELWVNNLFQLAFAPLWGLFALLGVGYPLGLLLGRRIFKEHLY